jgi:DNA polymerase (family 10)
VRQHDISSEAGLEPLLDAPPPEVEPEVLRQLRGICESGAWVMLESAIADLPIDLRWLFESGVVTIEQLATLHQALGATSTADLLAAARQQAIRNVPGLDPTVEAAIATALPTLRRAVPRVALGRAIAIAEPILQRLRELPGVEWASAVGSLRRGVDTVGDIELVAPVAAPEAVLDALARMPGIARHLHRGARRLYVLFERVQIGVRCPEPRFGGAALLHLTGNPAHFASLCDTAAARGWTLGPDGLYTGSSSSPISEGEEEIYNALDLPLIPPELREGHEAVAAAREGRLPTVVERGDIRGDLHMHSTWSDGRDSIEVMVLACAALGYEYLAITDHSPRSAAARNLTLDGVARQADEIAALRERYPQIGILHGCEADILPDGSLDFPDRVLERFDVVLASLHEQAGHGPDQLLARYLKAMEHPLVAMITHPTNRLVPHRPGYDIDYARLIAAAVETRTVLEIDGAPAHLDMDGRLARQAIEAGATVAIDSDCHRSDMLGRQMGLGLLMARRGWVEPRHVLNTRPLAEVRAAIAAKRSR